MAITEINLSGNVQGLPAVNLTTGEETGKIEKTVFVKPHEDGFCLVSTYGKDGKIYVDHAEITLDSQGRHAQGNRLLPE